MIWIQYPCIVICSSHGSLGRLQLLLSLTLDASITLHSDFTTSFHIGRYCGKQFLIVSLFEDCFVAYVASTFLRLVKIIALCAATHYAYWILQNDSTNCNLLENVTVNFVCNKLFLFLWKENDTILISAKTWLLYLNYHYMIRESTWNLCDT